MLPGPEYIYKCPKCGNLLKNESVMSGNTFGAKFYSDGKAISPMLPENIILTSCKKCDAMFWLSQLKELGFIGWDTSENPGWENADELKLLTITEYLNALKIGIAKDKKSEIFIREQIWWLYNDRIRNDQKIFKDENDELIYIENINRLKQLVKPSIIISIIKAIFNRNVNKQKLTLAELNRNLGNFEDCMKILKSVDDKVLNVYRDKIMHECSKNNKYVFEIVY